MLKQVSLIFSLLIISMASAQVSFIAKTSRDKVGINERIKVEFEVNQDGDNFVAPDFTNFKRFGGPMQSMKQQWINGESSFLKKYTYYLQPTKRGTLTIGQAEIEVEGKVYKTSPIKIEVTAAVDNPDDGNGNRVDLSNAIHLVAEVSNFKPYINEGISVTYKLYVDQTTNVRGWQNLDEPKFTNFWSQNLKVDQNQVKQGSYGGTNYRYVELRKTVLYPQKSGKLTIEPLSLSVSVEVPSDRRDFFGRRLYDVVERTISAKSRTINVQDLPTADKPVDFSGAVGQFKLETDLSKSELLATESLNFKVKVSGTGNLKLFNLPKPKLPSSVDVYDPEHIEKVSASLSGLRGQIIDDYTVVPNLPGNLQINPVQFSYFDPQSETYKTLSSQPKQLNVKPNPNASVTANTSSGTSTSNTTANAVSKNTISAVNNFNFIALETNLKPIHSTQFYNSTWFWLLIIVSFLGLPLIIWSKRVLQSSNSGANHQTKRANKLAKKFLSDAKKSIGSVEVFYTNLELALHKFLKAKLKIETTDLSKDVLRAQLAQQKVSTQSIDALFGLIEKCELARYASTAHEDMQNDYAEAARLISSIDKQI